MPYSVERHEAAVVGDEYRGAGGGDALDPLVLDPPVYFAQKGEPPSPGADVVFVEAVVVVRFGKQVWLGAALVAEKFGQSVHTGLFGSEAQFARSFVTGNGPVVLHGVQLDAAGDGDASGPGGAEDFFEWDGSGAGSVEDSSGGGAGGGGQRARGIPHADELHVRIEAGKRDAAALGNL